MPVDMAKYMNARYYDRREALIGILGGSCVDCGSAEHLEFDHVHRSDKSFTIGTRLASAPWPILLAEAAKCSLRCQKCHLVKTAAESSVSHGGGVSGRRNCPCEPCRSRKAEYMASYVRPSRRA